MKKKNNNEICEKENEFDESGINVVIVVFWFCAKVRLTRRRFKKKKNMLSWVLFPLWFNFLHYLLKTNPEMKNKRVKNLRLIFIPAC